MKYFLILLLALALAPGKLHAQNEALHTFFERHQHNPGFTHAFLSKDLFEVVSQTNIQDKDWKKIHNVVKNIGSLRLLAADSIQNGLSLYKEVLRLVPTDVFEEMLTVRDGKDNVRIWVKAEESAVTDLILLVGSPDKFVLVCFSGNLELGNISELAALFEAGEAEQLAQAAQATAIAFKISPNPNDGSFTLSYEDGQDHPAFLSVMDQNGRLLSAQNLSDSPTQNVVLDGLPSGLYWIQLKTQGGKIGVKQMQVVKK